nr:PTS sugar transporter subunit IIC [Staphylococcus sp. McC-251-APC-3A2]
MKNYLHRWIIEALSYMALGLFGSLIIGLILETLGEQTLLPQLNLTFLSEIGKVAMSMTGAAIGVAIAYGLGAKPLVTFSCVIVGTLGYTTFDGGPVGAYIATVIVVELSRLYGGIWSCLIFEKPMISVLYALFFSSAFTENRFNV